MVFTARYDTKMNTKPHTQPHTQPPEYRQVHPSSLSYYNPYNSAVQ